jgi:hypothetical protein
VGNTLPDFKPFPNGPALPFPHQGKSNSVLYLKRLHSLKLIAVVFRYLILFSPDLANCHLQTQLKNYSAYREASHLCYSPNCYKHDEIKEEMGEECETGEVII